MKKWIFILHLIMTMFVISSAASAETRQDYAYRILDDGTAEITGYSGSGQDIIIPGSVNGAAVTSIGNFAFSGCGSLISVFIPEGVTSIGGRAFEDCSSMVSITIPDSVTSIGILAFSGCGSLTSVTLPKNITAVENYMFSGCGKLASVTIPGSVLSIGDSAFLDCVSLTSIDIPDSVTSIGDHAFSGCGSLASVTLPGSVKSIGKNTFRGCGDLVLSVVQGSYAEKYAVDRKADHVYFDPEAPVTRAAADHSDEPWIYPAAEITETPVRRENPAESPAPTKTPAKTPVPTKTPAPTQTPAKTAAAANNINVGDIISFGHFEQDNNKSNGPEPVRWKVIGKANSSDGFPAGENMMLLISTKALAAMPFNTGGTNSWDVSSLRKWLQGTFYDSAFNASERKAIRKVSHKADPREAYPDTDTVFVLSLEEIRRFLPLLSDRQFGATAYAVSQNVYRGNNGFVCWWTRSYYGKGIAYNVWSTGDMTHGATVTDNDGGVLPAVWINADEWKKLP